MYFIGRHGSRRGSVLTGRFGSAYREVTYDEMVHGTVYGLVNFVMCVSTSYFHISSSPFFIVAMAKSQPLIT